MAESVADSQGGPPDKWVQHLQEYRQAQLRPDLYEAAKRREPKVTHGSVMARDRAFDPVLGRFRDGAVERATAQREREAAVAASNRGRDKQLRVSQRYDIVTHKALVDDEPVATARPPSQTYRSRVGFNIISNEPLANHHFDRPDRRPRGGDSGVGGGGARAHVAHASMDRDFDVVTGRYLADHEAKAARDEDIARRRAADRWWQTRDFDPVRQRFYDAEKDAKAAAAEAAAQQRRGAAKAAALPPAERLRETAGYDVVGHRVIDEERMRVIDARIHRPLVRPLRQETEARLTKEGVVAAERAAGRSVRRAALKNARDLPDRRPFDMLTGAPLRGVDAAEAHAEETRSLFKSRVRDPMQEPAAVRAAHGARRVKATGDAWRAVKDKAPPSTRVRRR